MCVASLYKSKYPQNPFGKRSIYMAIAKGTGADYNNTLAPNVH